MSSLTHVINIADYIDDDELGKDDLDMYISHRFIIDNTYNIFVEAKFNPKYYIREFKEYLLTFNYNLFRTVYNRWNVENRFTVPNKGSRILYCPKNIIFLKFIIDVVLVKQMANMDHYTKTNSLINMLKYAICKFMHNMKVMLYTMLYMTNTIRYTSYIPYIDSIVSANIINDIIADIITDILRDHVNELINELQIRENLGKQYTQLPSIIDRDLEIIQTQYIKFIEDPWILLTLDEFNAANITGEHLTFIYH